MATLRCAVGASVTPHNLPAKRCLCRLACPGRIVMVPFKRIKARESGSPLCQEAAESGGVASCPGPVSGCSEVLAMGIWPVALD